MVDVKKDHFVRSAAEIGFNGDNDTLPYDIDSAFIKDKSTDLAEICITLYKHIESLSRDKAVKYVSALNISNEKLLVPTGSHGFRLTTKIHPFWNLYLNGIGLAIAEANENRRSSRVHSYRLSREGTGFFDKERSWRSYKTETVSPEAALSENSIVIQTDISSFYEHIYHHRLENSIDDISLVGSNIGVQIDRILSKLAAGRSFGLPVGGQCARFLAELMMTPIDQALSDSGLNWFRYVDDFTIICKDRADSYKALSVLSHSLADYGLTLNRTKTTILSSKHYRDLISAQIGDSDHKSSILHEIDLHFDPYSDNSEEEYENLKKAFEGVDVTVLLDLEKDKSEPDAFIMAQIGRALKFQDERIAINLCSTLLDPSNLDSFRASWSKIMRGIYAVRSRPEFSEIWVDIDILLDGIPEGAPHLLVPEANILHYLRAIRFVRTDTRGLYVRSVFDSSKSPLVRRACIDCWKTWADRPNFTRTRGQWASLTEGEQRMLWLSAPSFGDEGSKARQQLRKSIPQAWEMGFEEVCGSSFSDCFLAWADNVV